MPVRAARCLNDGRIPCARRPALHQPRVRVAAHGGRAVSAASGTELSVVGRQCRTVRSFPGLLGPTVDAHVAGLSALLRVKAHMIDERLDPTELRRNVDRMRPDSSSS